MKLYAFNFVEKPVADYSVQGTLEKEIDYWEKFLTNHKGIGTYGTLYDFYVHGYVRAGGIQFQPANENGVDWTEVMIQDGCGMWYTRHIPSTDPEIIEKFLEAYELDSAEDQQIRWFVKPEVNMLYA